VLTNFPVRPLSERTLRRKDPTLWPALVVFALGCLAYAASADVWFLKDDLAMSLLTDAEGRPSVDQLVRNFLWPTSMTHDQFYRPLPVLFGWYDLKTFGADPAGFRLCNIGFHGLNGVLLAILFNQLTRFRRPAAGWFAGVLFALHPLHGEAVLWITQRMVVMCATFSLLTLIALESFIRTRRAGSLATCVVSAIAAALCKEVTVALPASMVAISLTAPAADLRHRIRRTLVVGALGAALSAAVLVLRRVIFGVWVGTYGNLSAAEYARALRVFERMPESLVNGLLGVNAIETPPKVRVAFGIAALAFAAYAVFRLIVAFRERNVARAAAVFATLAAASFIPTMGIFYIEPSLMNGRFLYQPLLGVVGLLLLGFTSEARARPLIALAAPASLAIVYALAGQINLRAFAGADAQIRAVREGIAREASAAGGDVAAIVYRVPSEWHGVVTLDRSLELAMRPPFVDPPGIEAFPFVAGLEASWPDRVPELRSWLDARPGRRLLHLVCAEDPFRVSPLIGQLEPAAGASPPDVLAPADGALVVHPAEPPTFVFQPVRGASSYRLALDSGGFEVEIDLAERNLKRVGTRREYRFALGSSGARARTGDGPKRDLPDPAAVWSEPSIESPAPIAWSLEALDANGNLLGRSAERALVLVTTKGF
jgi:hypothetical protein